MATTTPTAVQEKADAVLDAIGDASIPDGTVGFHEHPLTKAADAQALTSRIGRIVYAGSSPSGTKTVQFDVDGGDGFGSAWPEWAFEIARDALLHNVKVRVLADGDPFGSNLTVVLLYAP